MISASSAGPTIECPARLALPAARTTSEAADRGTELHEFCRVVTKNPGAREEALKAVPEKWRHTAAGINLAEALEGLKIVGCERAYALDVEKHTVRYIGENINREYGPCSRYEIPFSIDVEASVDGIPVELDYKSGQSIGDPQQHWQRRICAIGLMLFHDTPTAISRVTYIWDDGKIVSDGCEFSLFDVDEFCTTLKNTIDRVYEARELLASGVMPTVYPSDTACAFCPALTSCPAHTNFAKAMLGRLGDIEKGPELSSLTPEERGTVWAQLKQAEKIVEMTLASLKKMTPFPVGEEHEVRPTAKSRSYFDDAKARGLIVTLLDQAGVSEDEIKAKLASLNGRTEYAEFRKQKRLPQVAA